MGLLLTSGRNPVDSQLQALAGKPRAGELDLLPFLKERKRRLLNPNGDHYIFARDGDDGSFGTW